MVIKPLPANSTAVGNPARIVDKKKSAEKKAVEDAKAQVRLAAYGIVANEEDPYVLKLKQMEAKLAEQQARIEALEKSSAK